MEEKISEVPKEIEDLLKEIRVSRESLYDMLVDLDLVREKIDNLFPEKTDLRYARTYQERIKSLTEWLRAYLEIKKEINRNIREEFEMRKRITSSSSDEEDEKIQEFIRKVDEGISKKRYEQEQEPKMKVVQGEANE